MPTAIPPPTALTERLCRRLERTSPSAQEHQTTCSVLTDMLSFIRNLPAIPLIEAPPDPTTPMARIYDQLAIPAPGSPPGPLCPIEKEILRRFLYLVEVEIAPRLEPSADLAQAHPESRIHAHLQHELRREFGLLGFAVPDHWREPAVSELAPLILVRARELGFQPTEVRLMGAVPLPPVPGTHMGGMRLWLVAWNGATPLPPAATTASPNVWDPNNPLGNGHDLLLAPLRMVLTWTDDLPAAPP